VRAALRRFPALVLTGPRRAGKTWLLRRHLFPAAAYFLLEDPDIVARLRADPQGFLDAARPPVILDEVQHVPEIFAFVRARIDRQPRRVGQWLLTGSQEAPLMQGVSESMAGRAAVLQLLPLSTRESPKVSLRLGGYPEAVARPAGARLWFSSYVQTYLERDVRAVTMVRDLSTFRRFLALVAPRHEQLINKTDLAAPLGVSVPTIGQWLGILETTAQILVVPPFYENLGRRLVKRRAGARSGLRGARPSWHGRARGVQGRPGRSRQPWPCRSRGWVRPGRRRPAAAAWRGLVHRPPRAGSPTAAVAPGIRALSWQDFPAGREGR
jgi:predicted AAA+ superfamily ATPase